MFQDALQKQDKLTFDTSDGGFRAFEVHSYLVGQGKGAYNKAKVLVTHRK